MGIPRQHVAIQCNVDACNEHAWTFLEVADLFIGLCDVHQDLCAECFALVQQDIAWEGNVCSACRAERPDSYAELGMYMCHPRCPDCGSRWG